MPHYRYWENPNFGDHGGQPIEPPEPLEHPMQPVQPAQPEQPVHPEVETDPMCRCPEDKCVEDCRCKEDCKCRKDTRKKNKRKKDKKKKKRRKRDEIDRTGRCPAHTRTPWGKCDHPIISVRCRYFMMAVLCLTVLAVTGAAIGVSLSRKRSQDDVYGNTNDRRGDSVNDRVVTEWRKVGGVALIDHPEHDITASEDDEPSVDAISQALTSELLLSLTTGDGLITTSRDSLASPESTTTSTEYPFFSDSLSLSLSTSVSTSEAIFKPVPRPPFFTASTKAPVVPSTLVMTSTSTSASTTTEATETAEETSGGGILSDNAVSVLLVSELAAFMIMHHLQ